MLDVVLFGEFRVSSEGSLLAGLRSPRTQALLGYLALHPGTPQARQQVASLFWPDSTDAQARTNLRRELHTLRAGLPDPDAVLAVDQTGIWWRDDGACRIARVDVERPGLPDDELLVAVVRERAGIGARLRAHPVVEVGRTEARLVPQDRPCRLRPAVQLGEVVVEREFVDGKIQAMFVSRLPQPFRDGNPNLTRLFADPQAEEERYLREEGYFPIMHVLAIKREVYE